MTPAGQRLLDACADAGLFKSDGVREAFARQIEQIEVEARTAGEIDPERLARALHSVDGGGRSRDSDPDEIVGTDTRTGKDLTALDYPEEWFATPREMASAIAREYAALTPEKETPHA